MLFLKRKIYQNSRICFLDTKYVCKIQNNAAIIYSLHDVYNINFCTLSIKTTMGSISLLTRFLVLSTPAIINKKMKKSFYLFFFLSVQNNVKVDKIALYQTTNSFRFFCSFLKKKMKLLSSGKK